MGKHRPFKIFIINILIIFSASSCFEQQQDDAVKIPEYPCDDPLGCIIIGPDDPMKIGVLQALEGPVSPFGRDQLRGVELAIQRHGGRVLGHSVELVIENSKCSDEGGITGAEALAAENMVAGVIGATCSSATAQASRILSEAGLVMISGGSTAPSLTSFNGEKGEYWQPGFFRTCYNDMDKGGAAALFIRDILQKKKGAVIYGNNPYAIGIKDVLEYEFSIYGEQMVYSAMIENMDDKNSSIIIEEIIQNIIISEVELVILPLFQPYGELFIKTANKYEEFKNIVIIADDTLLLDSVVTITRDYIGDFYFITPAIDPARPADAIFSAYRAKYQEEPVGINFIYAYDAAYVLLYALEESASRQEDGSLVIGRQKLRDFIHTINDYWGISGSLSYDGTGDLGASRFNILYQDNKRYTVKDIHQSVVYSVDKHGSDLSFLKTLY